MSDSIVAQSSRSARRAVLIAFIGAAAILAALFVERAAFQVTVHEAAARVGRAVDLADRILLLDERLTMSARMAAATGEKRWIERYQAHLPRMKEMIEAAAREAPPEILEDFHRQTRMANAFLASLEADALENVERGELAAARAIFDTPAYDHHKRRLSRGIERFLAALDRDAQRRFGAVERQGVAVFVLVLTIGALGMLLIWILLGRHLGASQEAHAAAEERIRTAAQRDALTELANRRHFIDHAKAAVAAAREKDEAALILLDLDRFKPINDRFGHAAGDTVLKTVAARLCCEVREDDVVARLGGDEFAILLRSVGRAQCERIAERMLAGLRTPIALEEENVVIGGSIGVAFCPRHGRDVDLLLHRADLALYRAKRSGAGRCVFFARDMEFGSVREPGQARRHQPRELTLKAPAGPA